MGKLPRLRIGLRFPGLSAQQGAGVATYAVIKSRGTPLDDVPNEMSDDYKPYDQRAMVFIFVKSPKL